MASSCAVAVHTHLLPSQRLTIIRIDDSHSIRCCGMMPSAEASSPPHSPPLPALQRLATFLQALCHTSNWLQYEISNFFGGKHHQAHDRNSEEQLMTTSRLASTTIS
jgi:hypothetical protein